MRTASILVLVIAGGLSACGEHPALSRSAPVPQPPAHLAPTLRAQLSPFVDVSAAQRFFQTMSQADADRLLAGMGFPQKNVPGETRDVLIPIRSSDPRTQATLDRMWLPYWRLLPREAVEQAEQPYAGRWLAKAAQPSVEKGAQP
ncbi:MAG TPA: hypothetical protein VGB15_20035 [Longimicrobium sp.]|jgi:hypothetical protein